MASGDTCERARVHCVGLYLLTPTKVYRSWITRSKSFSKRTMLFAENPGFSIKKALDFSIEGQKSLGKSRLRFGFLAGVGIRTDLG